VAAVLIKASYGRLRASLTSREESVGFDAFYVDRRAFPSGRNFGAALRPGLQRNI